MKLSIIALLTILAPWGLMAPAMAYSPEDLEQLKQTGICARCDLTGAPLSQLNLSGANLRNANLSQADYLKPIWRMQI